MSQQIPSRQHAEVSRELFMGVIWALLSTSLVFVIARIVIKLRTFKRLFWEDALVVLAWSMLLATAILWRYNIHIVYQNYEIVQGKRPFDLSAIRNWDRFLRLIVPLNVLFYTSLWTVKLSFMLFFGSFGKQIRSYQIHWWVVLVLTIIGYLGCIADIQYECTVPAKPVEFVLQNCSTQQRIDWVNRTFYANCAVDIITDLLIMSIPIVILWNTRVPLQKKIVLCCIFSATVAIMVVAVIRVGVVNSRHANAELAWLYFWTFVENGIAIMIACVASFRQLFVSSNPDQPGSSNVTGPSKKRSLRFFRSQTRGSDQYAPAKPTTPESAKDRWTESKTKLAPLDFVTVHQTPSVASTPRASRK